ncbi:hypothetical protein X801_03859 [Opisthorchis viverrini]|uniref:Uncharacterized protein n=2 Tax=Opisthorchis viverrini TaxID=6198 RepID=A0A1S8X0V5_OPIVI|nr:hypothetical protein X801_03859 [Opisthorchis viverrini]
MGEDNPKGVTGSNYDFLEIAFDSGKQFRNNDGFRHGLREPICLLEVVANKDDPIEEDDSLAALGAVETCPAKVEAVEMGENNEVVVVVFTGVDNNGRDGTLVTGVRAPVLVAWVVCAALVTETGEDTEVPIGDENSPPKGVKFEVVVAPDNKYTDLVTDVKKKDATDVDTTVLQNKTIFVGKNS